MSDEFRFRFGKAKEVAAYSQKLNVIKINLKYVESVSHLYEIIEHEVLHKVLWRLSLPIRREHKLIDRILWANYEL